MNEANDKDIQSSREIEEMDVTEGIDSTEGNKQILKCAFALQHFWRNHARNVAKTLFHLTASFHTALTVPQVNTQTHLHRLSLSLVIGDGEQLTVRDNVIVL